jgi:TolB-like protein/tetratricopeptide (TPR) repeat protein
MTSNQPVMQNIIGHWRERGLTDVDAAISFANDAYKVIDPSEAADFIEQLLQRWPNHVGITYQAHRTYLWAGRVMEARQLADRHNRLVSEPNNILNARQACVEGRRDEAEALLLSVDSNENDLVSTRWHILKLLGRDQEADDELRPIAQSGIPYQIADMLSYLQFDPSPYPSLVAELERRGIKRPPPLDIPFKCPPPEGTSIAVLPFVNMSNDPDNEFFSDGIAEELLNVLASIPELKVAARTSAFAFKGTNTNISRIAEELGVNHVLEGSVRKAGNQVRVTAQLIQASDGFHLWSANYDRELTNIFAIQDEIAGSIADALKVTLELESGDAGNLTGTNSIEAYEHYLQGMQLWYLRTVDSLNRAISEFEAAIQLDPEFAKAHAGLALTWGVYDGYANFDSQTAQQNTIAAADRALELDPKNVEAMAIKGIVHRARFEYNVSEDLFKKAIQIQPSFASAYQWYGSALFDMGDPEAGILMLQKAWNLDPRSRIIGLNLSTFLDGLGQREEGIKVLHEVLAFAPDFPDAIAQLMLINMFEGKCDEAAVNSKRLAQLLNKQNPALEIYQDVCQSDDLAKREHALDVMMAWPEFDFASPTNPSISYIYDFLNILIRFGEHERVWLFFSTLEKEDVEGLLTGLRGFRTENGIRLQCDPRTDKMAQELGLPLQVKPVTCD